MDSCVRTSGPGTTGSGWGGFDVLPPVCGGGVDVLPPVRACPPVPGVLDSGAADFEDGEEVFDAVGGVLQEVSADDKNEEDIRDICGQMFNSLKL